MPVYRPWISPYGDDDFDWDHDTFAERDFVFEAARIVFRSPLVRRQDTRRRLSNEPVQGRIGDWVLFVRESPGKDDRGVERERH